MPPREALRAGKLTITANDAPHERRAIPKVVPGVDRAVGPIRLLRPHAVRLEACELAGFDELRVGGIVVALRAEAHIYQDDGKQQNQNREREAHALLDEARVEGRVAAESAHGG